MFSLLAPRSAPSAVAALAAQLLSSLTFGLHAGGDSVGQASLAPQTIYFSEHTGGSDEEHLHAESGFESVLCLACFQSLRNQTSLAVSPTLLPLTDFGYRGPSGLSSAPSTANSGPFSSRAPPLA